MGALVSGQVGPGLGNSVKFIPYRFESVVLKMEFFQHMTVAQLFGDRLDAVVVRSGGVDSGGASVPGSMVVRAWAGVAGSLGALHARPGREEAKRGTHLTERRRRSFPKHAGISDSALCLR